MEKKVLINKIIKKTKVEGFGNRYCIWFQGCNIHCPDCANQHMWSFEKGKELEVTQIVKDIEKQEDIEGITLLGGEPLDQIEASVYLVKAARIMGLSTIVFTGYIYENLIHKRNPLLEELLKFTDLLIDGPFKKEMLDYSRLWVGSKNQRYIFLSERYSDKELKKDVLKNKYEIRISPNGIISLNGMGDLSRLGKIIELKGGRKSEKIKDNYLP